MAQAGVENDAHQFAANRVAQMLYANDAGTATFQLGVPEVAALRTVHAAQQKQLAYGSLRSSKVTTYLLDKLV